MTDSNVKTYIRTSKHSLKFANSGKLQQYHEFVSEMRKTAQIYVDFLWNHSCQWNDKNGASHSMCIDCLQLDIPPFFDYNLIPLPIENKLSARAKSSLVTQCMGIVKAATEKYRKQFFILNKLIKENKPVPFKLLERLVVHQPVKPTIDKINIEISSKNIDFQKVNGEFDLFIRLKSLGDFNNINMPIKMHKRANKWKNKAEMKGSILCSDKNIDIRWEIEQPLKTVGKTIGIDQGKNVILTCSDSQVTPEKNEHGHTLNSIMRKLERKKKGSKSFRKSQDHRENFINWSINQISLINVLNVKYEDIKQIYSGIKMSRYMRHWIYAFIGEKVERICEENGVHFLPESPTYRSQRCSECGWVHKKNRNGRIFICTRCGAFLDADFNASRNHEVELPFISKSFMKLNLNRSSGFYWNSEGLFSEDGEEFRVPLSQNEVKEYPGHAGDCGA